MFTGEELWFNQAPLVHGGYWKLTWPELYSSVPLDKTPHHAQYADGTEISEDILHV